MSTSNNGVVATITTPTSEPTREQLLTAAAATTPESDAVSAEEQAAAAQRAAEQAAEEEAGVRRGMVADLDAMVKCYRRGERAYSLGLLGSGMYAHRVVVAKMRLRDKRRGGVQAVESTLAPYATDVVDCGRLIRCWAAHQLLGVEQGLAEPLDVFKGRKVGPADSIPYGHYRDAWSRLVHRAAKDTATEHYTLLPGLEEECRKVFREGTEASWTKEAAAEHAQGLVLRHQRLEQEAADKAAEEARAKREAAEEANREQRERAEEANRERKAAEQVAREANDAVKRAKDDDTRREAEAKAAEARQEAEAKRKTAEAERFAAEQARREEARAKEEARQADKRKAEAEAKRKAAEGKADRKATKGSGSDKPGPSPEARQGENLLKSGSAATAKDLAGMVRAMVQGNADPHAALYEVMAALCGEPSKGLTADDVVRTVFLALDKARLAKAFHATQVGKAIEAARLVLTRKEQAAA
jgi:membrane protein involved in colicin uptake